MRNTKVKSWTPRMERPFPRADWIVRERPKEETANKIRTRMIHRDLLGIMWNIRTF